MVCLDHLPWKQIHRVSLCCKNIFDVIHYYGLIMLPVEPQETGSKKPVHFIQWKWKKAQTLDQNKSLLTAIVRYSSSVEHLQGENRKRPGARRRTVRRVPSTWETLGGGNDVCSIIVRYFPARHIHVDEQLAVVRWDASPWNNRYYVVYIYQVCIVRIIINNSYRYMYTRAHQRSTRTLTSLFTPHFVVHHHTPSVLWGQ